MKQELQLRLNDPGMSPLHRAGLAGLWMTLSSLRDQEGNGDLEWPSFFERPPHLEPHGIGLSWNGSAREMVTWLLDKSFRIRNGLMEFASLRGASEEAKVEIQQALLGTFLQHGRTRGLKNGIASRSVQIEDVSLLLSYHEVVWYAHQRAVKILCDGDNWAEIVPLAGWLAPGGVVRHSAFAKETALAEPPQRALLLLYAPLGCFYFNLRSAKRAQKARFALVIPQIDDLDQYSRIHRKVVNDNLKEHTASGPGDAALRLTLELKTKDQRDQINCDSCQVFTLGTVPWSTQQKTRTSVIRVDLRQVERIRIFEKLAQVLPNRAVRGKANRKGEAASGFIATSRALEHFSDNLVETPMRKWYSGFAELMIKTEDYEKLRFERKELGELMERIDSELSEGERALVKACHQALGKRYRDIRDRDRGNDEKIINALQNREYERLRVRLGRCKNASSLRQELIDFWTRGGHQKTLQEHWQIVFPLVQSDWARARDLALLALASYKSSPRSDSDGQG